MKKDSSEEYMEDVLNILSTIEKVAPNTSLYNKIESKIQSEKLNIIPMNWLRVAAVGFLCFIAAEVYYFTDTLSESDDLSSMVSSIDNTLYNE